MYIIKTMLGLVTVSLNGNAVVAIYTSHVYISLKRSRPKHPRMSNFLLFATQHRAQPVVASSRVLCVETVGGLIIELL